MLLLQHLPAEVLSRICAYLVPSNYTFLLNSRSPQTPVGQSKLDPGISPRYKGTPLLQDTEPGHPQRPADVSSHWGIDILATMLLHSRIYPHIVECLYSNNIFYPPDLTTLLCLRDTWSPLAVSSIRTIRVDACGAALRTTRNYNYAHTWHQPADVVSIVRIPELFPGVRELRLGGVGPGIVYRRSFTYRGRSMTRDHNFCDTWTMDNASLVKKIIGVGTVEGLSSFAHENGVETVGKHVLIGGRVICMRYDRGDEESLPQGSHRLHGTRIVRHGDIVKLGSREQEVFDIDAILQRAREAHEEHKAMGYH